MCNYDIEYQGGTTIKTKVLDQHDIVDSCISLLRSSLIRRVVGLDVKATGFKGRGQLLILCRGTQCLVIQLSYLDKETDILESFLADSTICFVGRGMNELLKSITQFACKTGVECGELAAKVLKKPSLLRCGLSDLSKEVGLDRIHEMLESRSTLVSWGARVFTHEEVKYAIRDAYASYVIGNKLLGML